MTQHSYNDTTESTSLLNRGRRGDCCDDGTTTTSKRQDGGLGRRLKDILFGAIVAAVVAILVVQSLQPKSVWNNNSTDGNDSSPDDTTTTSTTIIDTEQSPSSKSHLRPLLDTHKEGKIVSSKDTIHQQLVDNNTDINSDFLVSKYEKFQAFGFQIYTGGAPALMPVPDSTAKHHKQPKFQNNPECEGRLNTLGHFNEDPAETDWPITYWNCYLGHEDPIQDALQRVQVMVDAVAKAEDFADKDPKTLKIFNAPEFFFRGKDGAYVFDYDEEVLSREESCTAVCQLMKGLEDLVAQEKYKDWIFLFGTIIVAEGPLPDTYESDYWHAGNYLLYNFAPVYKGYDPKVTDHQGKRFLVPKRFISQFDFLTSPGYYNGSIAQELEEMKQDKVQRIGDERSFYDTSDPDLFIPVVPDSGDSVDGSKPLVENPYSFEDYQLYYDKDMWKQHKDELEKLGYKLLEHHWLILDNITMSIEICLDHLPPSAVALRTAQVDDIKGSPLRIPMNVEHWDETLNKYVGGLNYVRIPRNQAQISLVSSMGMEADPGALALVDGGTLILQDGEHPGSGSITSDVDCNGFSTIQFTGGSQVISRTSNFGETTYTYYNHEMRNPMKSALVYNDNDAFRKAADGVFTTTTYKPTIHAYPPSDIAKVN